jgi:hypothetical protein
MFSKPLITYNSAIFKKTEQTSENEGKKKREQKDSVVLSPIEMSYMDYFKQSISLSKYKVVELKQIAKFNHLKVSGTKPLLIERIDTMFKKSKKVQKLQSVYRGYITRKSFQLRGDAYKNRKICVNENDFYTLEPLCEIPMEYFISFNSDDKKFTFGCNIISLMHLIKTKKTLKNPYNREVIGIDVIQNIIILYKLISIIFTLPVDAPKIENMNYMLRLLHSNTNLNRRIESIRPQQRHELLQTTMIRNSAVVQERTQLLNTIRAKPFAMRIQGLFMDIDLLGNYTNMSWFTTLERRDFIRMYRILYEIWNYRGGLSMEIKQKICVVADPFYEITRRNVDFYQAPISFIQEICLKVMEYLVYGGIDDEYRKIGTLHVLSALTVVSTPARMAMPWLYESIHY